MIKYILEILRQNKLMDVVEADAKEMFDLAMHNFSAGARAALYGKHVDFDLYASDRKINMKVINTRKRVLEHLSIGQTKNPVGELVIITLINHIERIGDHSKNMYDLYRRLDGPIEESFYLPLVKGLFEKVEGFFPKARKALFEDDEEMAAYVMEGHLAVVKTEKGLMRDLLYDEEISAKQGIALTVAIRSIKRVSAHLKTISSSAVSPFTMLGFRQMPDVKKSIEDNE